MTRGAMVLVADVVEMRKLVAGTLRRVELSVREVCNGREMLAEIRPDILRGPRRRAFDLVVPDVRMPGRNPTFAVAARRVADAGPVHHRVRRRAGPRAPRGRRATGDPRQAAGPVSAAGRAPALAEVRAGAEATS